MPKSRSNFAAGAIVCNDVPYPSVSGFGVALLGLEGSVACILVSLRCSLHCLTILSTHAHAYARLALDGLGSPRKCPSRPGSGHNTPHITYRTSSHARPTAHGWEGTVGRNSRNFSRVRQYHCFLEVLRPWHLCPIRDPLDRCTPRRSSRAVCRLPRRSLGSSSPVPLTGGSRVHATCTPHRPSCAVHRAMTFGCLDSL